MRTINKETKFLIVGLGVMGAAYARILSGKGYRVFGITKDSADLDYALRKHYIEKGNTEPTDELLKQADIVICALHPHILLSWIERNQYRLSQGALITDVTGVKGGVVGQIQEMLRSDLEFVAVHPMAGREGSGIVMSEGVAFDQANYIIVPTACNTAEGLATARRLGEILGFAQIAELDVDTHDEMIAYLSQLTHCIAVALMTCRDSEHMTAYTGDSFRDLTRIARINDEMWSELFLLNKEKLLAQMDLFIDEITRMRDLLKKGDREGLRDMMRRSTARRALFDKPVTETSQSIIEKENRK